ncbi:MAG TPA: PDZ domain-containing protein [Myxococcales bacterium]|jgi:predicted metalloprotease with PDZ domain|nr:PDZ domain-containing protein [Myxococcales bacterium]
MNAYTFRIHQPEARRVEVELQVESRGANALDVRLPVWTPGSYLVREHQRHVDGLRASGDGRELSVEKIDKHTWRVRTDAARTVRISYRLHCFELTVRTNHVDGTHAFLNPSAAAAFVVGREGEPCAVRLQLPPGWRAWNALPFDDGAFKAQDYDELADSPFECGGEGSHSAHPFVAQGVQHELVVWGRGDFDARRVVPDLVKIIDAEAAIFGGLPYSDRYLFILHLNDKGRGGLEHRRSCALIVPRFSFVQKSAYEDFLLLVAHEFFHLWNVKRVRPSAFTPYDWTRENHTRLLWAMEGLTSTYEVLALLRARLITPQRFLEIWAERNTQLLRTPGRLRTSLAQASFDAWIKHYRPDESTVNTTVSYYLKGSIVGFLLDLELRRRSGGARSLDDLVRALFEKHGRPPGLPEDGVEKAAIELIGDRTLHEWFQRAVHSTEELQLEEALSGVGIEVVTAPASGADDKGRAEADPGEVPAADARTRGWLGATLREKAGALEIASIAEGSPAQAAGLAAGDEIAAADGFRTDLKQRLGRTQPGQTLRLSIFRMDELLEVVLKVAAAPRDTVTFIPNPKATPDQLGARERWLGARWPDE